MHARVRILVLALIFDITLCRAGASEAKTDSQGDEPVAIDVLLEPDQKMTAASEALNARLRGNYPSGYSLDALHSPHVSLLQRFVREKDFAAVTGVVTKILADDRPTEIDLKATGIDYVMWSGVAVTVLVVKRSRELMRLQQRVANAVASYSVRAGTSAAFVGGDANAATVDWVASFVPKSSGTNYQPHVTAGVASEAFVKGLKAEPFQPFTFRARGMAIYQLGNFGTAAKKLWPR